MDLDCGAMVKASHAFRDQADKTDWALIYFAGHGMRRWREAGRRVLISLSTMGLP